MPFMSQNVKQNAFNLLEKMSTGTKQKNVQSATAQEITRIKALSLQQLGQETVKHGKFAGQTCHFVFTEKADYLKWLLEHHEHSPKYLNVIWYAKRQALMDEMESLPKTLAQGGAAVRPRRAQDHRGCAPAWKKEPVCWSSWVADLYADDGVGDELECIPEEDVGNLLDLSVGDLGSRGVGNFDLKAVKTGCFANCSGVWEPLPAAPKGSDHSDLESYFCQAVDEQSQFFEISMDLQARDVHQIKQGGRTQWALNEKPKKRAEVQFRALAESAKWNSWGL